MGDWFQKPYSSKREKVNNSTHRSLTCSGKGSGLSTRIRAAQPRAESDSNARTFLETKCKATNIC